MELKKLQEHWAGFPAISMEERPVLICLPLNICIYCPAAFQDQQV